jgi:hypothetical protein
MIVFWLGQTLQDIPQATASSSNPDGERSLWRKIAMAENLESQCAIKD